MSYGGYPTLPGLTGITPAIVASRSSGSTPMFVHAHAASTAIAGTLPTIGLNTLTAYSCLEFTWDFGDPSGVETFTHPVTGLTINANADQTGPEAAYCYRTAGTYTITLTARGNRGTVASPVYVTAQATAVVTVADPAWSDLYFDPVSGLDANAGTIGSPKQTWSAVNTWLGASGATNRRAFLKRGTTFATAAAQVNIRFTCSGLRIAPYGTGAAPIVQVTVSTTPLALTNGLGRNPQDIVVSGVAFDGNGLAANCVSSLDSVNGTGTQQLTQYVYFDNCSFKGSTADRVSIQNYISNTATTRGNHYGFWGSAFDGGTHPNQEIFLHFGTFAFVLGCSFVGGLGNTILDHYIYPTVDDHSLYRWLDFGLSTVKDFCLNMNCNAQNDTAGPGGHYDTDSSHVLIDGCDITGTQNGHDGSNGFNDPTRSRFRDFISQNNAFHDLGHYVDTGQTGMQSTGIQGACIADVTVRDNVFYNLGRLSNGTNYQSGNVAISYGSSTAALTDTSATPAIYRNKIWHPADVNSGLVTLGQRGGGVFTDNTLQAMTPGTTANQYVAFAVSGSLTGWTVDRNQYYAPTMVTAAHGPFYDNTAAAAKTFVQWQGLGLDVNGSYADPAWPDPANGDFGTGGGGTTPPVTNGYLAVSVTGLGFLTLQS